MKYSSVGLLCRLLRSFGWLQSVHRVLGNQRPTLHQAEDLLEESAQVPVSNRCVRPAKQTPSSLDISHHFVLSLRPQSPINFRMFMMSMRSMCARGRHWRLAARKVGCTLCWPVKTQLQPGALTHHSRRHLRQSLTRLRPKATRPR